MPEAHLHKWFDWAQYAWESVAMERQQFRDRIGALWSLLAAHPLVTLVVLLVATPLCWIGWALFGWILLLPWRVLVTAVQLAWYGPLLYCAWRFVAILLRRLLRHYGQTQRAQSLAEWFIDWVRRSGQQLAQRLLWRSATAAAI